jgi:hypothetical protein
MSNRLFKSLLVVFSLTLLLGVGLHAQGLPDYGIRRLQTVPELSFGSTPQQAVIFNDKLVIQGVGFDTNHVFTVGSFFSLYDGVQLETVEFDTLRIRSSNDFERGAAMVVPSGFLSIRNSNYNSEDPLYTFSGSASILELSTLQDSQAMVKKIDTLWLEGFEAEDQSFFTSKLVLDLNPSLSDTVYVVFNAGFITNRQSIVEIKSYVPDEILGYSSVKQVQIVDGIESNDVQLGVWRFGDTLGRAQSILRSDNSLDLIVKYFNIYTGVEISRILVKKGLNRTPLFAHNAKNSLGYMTEFNIDWDAPRHRRTTTEITAFDLRTGELKWEDEYISRPDWFTNPDWEFTRVDSSGQTALTAYPSAKVYDNSTGNRDWQLELKAANALTGDSLWTTYLQLDSFATRDYGMVPMDIAMKPNGMGYVVVAGIAETKLDPNRDLRYAYTALFFLDSLGCLAPGCRETSSTKDPSLGYEISLAPNPVRAGGELSVSFPESVSEVRYAITNGQGQRLGFSGSESVLEGKLDVQIDDLPSGMYYLTVWPSGSGNAMLTRGFVVE